MTSWRATTAVSVVALLLAGICWYLGADVWHAVLFGGVLTTLGLIVLVGAGIPDLARTDWRAAPRPNREGARTEVTDLSWSLRGRYGRVSHRALRRVQQLARHRLAMRALDLRDPADRPDIERLIGGRAYAVLARDSRRAPSWRSLLHCLDALDAIDSTRPKENP